MKRFVLKAGAIALIVGSPTFPTSAVHAQSDPGLGPDIVAFCRVHITEPGFTTGTLGECTSYVQTLFKTDDGFVSHFCDGLEETQPDVFYSMFDSKSECIRTVRNQ